MKTNMRNRRYLLLVLLLSLVLAWTGQAGAVYVQCPGGDADCDGVSDTDPNIICKQFACGDGFVNMADGRLQYIFSFHEVPPCTPVEQVMSFGMLKAEFPAPSVAIKEGQELYLTLTNVGMFMRPDLFDAHSIHFHGFPQQAPVYDGEPMASFGVNMQASVTYHYTPYDPGTYMYHCHVEATEHMQMGMLGNIWVTSGQDGTPFEYPLGSGKFYTKFAFDDGDGSTGYDVDYPVQIHAFDPVFHDADLNIQPLNFAQLFETYPMLNGRGYPDTIKTAQLGQSAENDNYPSQKINSLIKAKKGQKILLRISNLSFDFYTLTVLGIPMTVVGRDARILRGPTGKNLYYKTNSVDTGGGESVDAILDTSEVAPGRYFLYTTNLHNLSNNTQERGGMMTEIVVNP